MSPPKVEFMPQPRIWSPSQVAAWFGRGLQWFRDRRTRLEAAGFPAEDELLGGTDAAAAKALFGGVMIGILALLLEGE